MHSDTEVNLVEKVRLSKGHAVIRQEAKEEYAWMQCSASLNQAFREHILFSMSEMFEWSMATGLSTGRTLSPVWALRRTNGANFTNRSPFADIILHAWRHRPLLCLRKTRRCSHNEAEEYYRFSHSALRVLNC